MSLFAPGARPRTVVLLAFILIGGLPFAGLAQDADGAAVTVVATDLANPRGFTWDGDELLVALAGSGGTEPARGQVQPPPVGPWTGGGTAALVAVDDDCGGKPIIEGLPSAVDATGGVIGAADVAVLDGTTYVLVAGGGEGHGNQGSANGVYAVTDDSESTLVADLSAWFAAYSVEQLPEADFDPEGTFYNMVVGDDGRLWISESNSEQILAVTTRGDIERIADLSAENMVPTGLAPASGGGVFVAYLSGAPYTDGSAKVIEVSPDGEVADVWTGLTMVTSIAVGPDGNLYAAEMSTGNSTDAPYVRPNSGRVVRQTGPATAEEIALGLPYPVAIDFGPDDALYVGFPGLGSEGNGGVVRIVLGDDPVDLAEADVLLTSCGEIALEPAATAEPTSEPEDEDDADAGTEGTGAAAPMPGMVAGVPDAFGNVRIDILDFAFDPMIVQVPAGARITFVNVGPTDHTTVAFDDGEKLWDSNIMVEGDVFSLSLTRVGRYEYICGLHPSMTAVIEIVE